MASARHKQSHILKAIVMDMFTEFGAARGQAKWSIRAAFRLTGAQRDEAKWG